MSLCQKHMNKDRKMQVGVSESIKKWDIFNENRLKIKNWNT